MCIDLAYSETSSDELTSPILAVEAHPEECRRKVKGQSQEGTSESEDLPQPPDGEAVAGPSGIISAGLIDQPELSESETGPSNSVSRLSYDVTYSSDDPDSRGQPNEIAQNPDLDLPSTSSELRSRHEQARGHGILKAAEFSRKTSFNDTFSLPQPESTATNLPGSGDFLWKRTENTILTSIAAL